MAKSTETVTTESTVADAAKAAKKAAKLAAQLAAHEAEAKATRKAAKAAKPAKASKAPADDFANPSEATGGGDSWNLTEEAEDELVLFTPLREDTVDTEEWGAKPIIVADVVVINTKKPEKSETHDEVYIFGGYLRGSLKSFIGTRRVLGRLEKGDTKIKGNYPWILADPSEADKTAAKAYLSSIDPFNA